MERDAKLGVSAGDFRQLVGRDVCYLVQMGHDGAIKIGHSRDVAARVTDLQISTPGRLVVRALLDGGLETERDAHRQFKPWRLTGEWFDATCAPLISDWIDRHSALLLGTGWTYAPYSGDVPIPVVSIEDPRYLPDVCEGTLEPNYYCRATKRAADVRGQPCRNRAGFKTDHLGVGRCWIHGGRSKVKHGRYRLHKPAQLQRSSS